MEPKILERRKPEHSPSWPQPPQRSLPTRKQRLYFPSPIFHHRAYHPLSTMLQIQPHFSRKYPQRKHRSLRPQTHPTMPQALSSKQVSRGRERKQLRHRWQWRRQHRRLRRRLCQRFLQLRASYYIDIPDFALVEVVESKSGNSLSGDHSFAIQSDRRLWPPRNKKDFVHQFCPPTDRTSSPSLVLVLVRRGPAVVMRNENALIFILAVSAIHSEALVAPGSCQSRNHASLPTQNHALTLLCDVPWKSSGLFIKGSAPSITGKYDQHHNHGRCRTELYTSVINGNANDCDELLLVNECHPRTMTVSESFTFFARFVVQTIVDNRNQQSSGRENRRRLRDRIFRKTKQEITSTVTNISTSKPKRGFRESMGTLNESRKTLIRLVGFDSSLLIPAFGYLILGAFMASVIPYYYSSCISCVAAGEANREKLLWAMGGLGVSHVLEAIFTGLRGALFWIAGEYFYFAPGRRFPCSILNFIIVHAAIRHSSQL